KGKVTLFNTGNSSQQSADFEKDGMTGIVKPVVSNSMILVGEQVEDIDDIATKLAPILKPM
ncbi:DUF3379 domain-containing protein, partial [Vibrio parahaemolyticus]|uniref:DUF3379 family protein n=1 Tax=Vibrio parahaemolyticus TaxID=670 RepID=UPI00211312E8